MKSIATISSPAFPNSNKMNASEVSWLSSLGLLHGYTEPLIPSWNSTEQELFSPGDLISKPYSGPTICEVEAAMSVGCGNGEADGQNNDRPVISLPEKGFICGKMENKYTLRIKACGNGVADDGYKWRKYGQKSIKNSPNPRSYYRCTNPRCSAKRQVERSTEDPETLIITYEGLHLHYTYSHFLLPQAHDHDQILASSSYHARKKTKTQTSDHEEEEEEEEEDEEEMQPLMVEPMMTGARDQQGINPLEAHAGIVNENPAMKIDEIAQQDLLLCNSQYCSNQGLLEDIVPLMVRKPCRSLSASSAQPCSSITQSSFPSYSSSFSLSPSFSQFDAAAFSSIVYERGCQKI